MAGAFIHRLRVRYGECDAQGVVFNAHYLAYFDVAITELWREGFGSYEAMTATGIDMVVAEARVRYLAPARFDDELDIAVAVASLGTTAMQTRFTIARAETAIAEGELRHVFVASASGAKEPIPAAVRQVLARYEAAPAPSADQAAPVSA